MANLERGMGGFAPLFLQLLYPFRNLLNKLHFFRVK